ncbi:MAG: type III-D CRISPR-associated protein Csx19 [Acidobacteriota bacterium]
MPDQRLNIAEEVAKLAAAQAVTADDVRICGGEFNADRLEGFIKAWDFSSMRYCIWERPDRIDFLEQLPAERGRLERARVFGKAGDLSLRRDGDIFRWHFIGAAIPKLPSNFQVENWKSEPEARLYRGDESALLWGRHNGEGDWYEDRVGRAELKYPGPEAERLRIHYTVFSQAGQVTFVWYREVENAKG